MPAPLYATYVPGDTISLPVTIRNTGNRRAVGTLLAPIVIDIRASGDNAYDLSDYVPKRIRVTSPIAAGSSIVRNVSITLPANAIPGSYYAVGKVDITSAVAEADETNNNTASAYPLNLIWQAGAIAGRPAVTSLPFTDADGTAVTLKLTGPGLATLGYDANGFDIAVTNTTSASTLTLTTLKSTTPGDDGRFVLHTLTVGNPGDPSNHTSIGTITASTTDLTGDITLTGSARSITWGNMTGGQHRLSVGTPRVMPQTQPSVNLTFARVENLTLDCAIGISSLKVTDWRDTDAVSDSVNAPWIASLATTGKPKRGLAGDFQADLTLTGPATTSTTPVLGSATIAGVAGAGTWDVTGASGAVSIGGMSSDFAANFTGSLAGLTVNGNASGRVSAKSIAAVTVGRNLAGSQILAGADLGSDATVGGIGDEADRFGRGYIGSITVTGTVTGSTLLAGVNPFDGQFNDLNDVAVGGGASYIGPISVGRSIDASSRIDAGKLPAAATIGGLAISTRFDTRFGQNRFALTDAGVTDSTGSVTFTVAGQSHTYRFLDETTQRPLSGASVSLTVDADSFSFGVITFLKLGLRNPIQFISLSGTAEPAAPQSFAVTALQSPSLLAAADPETVSASLATDLTTKTVLDLGTDWLTKQVFYTVPEPARQAVNSTVGCLASAFVSLVSIGLHGLDNVTRGAASDYLASLPLAESKVMTAEQAKADIVADRAVDLTGTVIYSTMMKKLDPLAPVATAIDLAADGVAWGTANSAGNIPNMGVRVTTIGPLKLVSYAPISTWDRMASDGTVLGRVPSAADAANGFIEYISKSNPGESFVTPLDTAGNASIAVPLGNYFGVVHAAGHVPGQVSLTVASGQNSLPPVTLAHAPDAGFVISPLTTLKTSENGASASFTVALKTRPTANVTLNLVCSDTSEGTINKTSLLFTPTNWATPKTVVVTGLDDSIVDGNVAYAIVTRPAVSADPAYSSLNPADVHVINVDNEEPTYPVFSTFNATAQRISPVSGWVQYKITVTGTISGPVGSYFMFWGTPPADFVMDSWTGLDGKGVRGAGYPYRKAGNPSSTTFSYTVIESYAYTSLPSQDYVVLNVYPPDSVGDFVQAKALVQLTI